MRGHFFRNSRCLTRRSRRLGFTLIELLVVVGIIALLIGILMPVLSKARGAANRAVCLSNIRQLGAGVLIYCNENKGWFPTCAYWANGNSYVQYPDDWVYWQANRKLDDSPIAKYVGQGEQFRKLLRCPADTFEGRTASPGISSGQGPYMYSYAMNDALASNMKPPFSERTKIGQWRSSSRKIMLIEMIEQDNTAPAWSCVVGLARRHGSAANRSLLQSSDNRMGINVSAVFLDGHAEGSNDAFACRIAQAQWWVQE